MFKLVAKSNFIYFLCASLFIYLIDLVLVRSALYAEHDQILTIGFALDFVVVLPILLYFLIYRKINKSFISVLPFALLGYLALLLFIPAKGQGTLEWVKYLLIPVELTFLGYEIYKLYQLITHFRRNHFIKAHPLETIRKSMEETFPHSNIAPFLLHDLSLFYYAFFAWRKKPYLQPDTAAFRYHTNSNWLITILILSKILLIEGVCVHILFMQWSPIVAWILSIGNVYIILLLVADYRAMCLNPILVSKQVIRLQYGLQLFSYVEITNIESVSVISSEQIAKDRMNTSFIPLVVEPNIRIQLKNANLVIRLFGKRQLVDQIYLFVDNPHEFQTACLTSMEGASGS
ncbi:hypothetical protein GCM10008018_70300 [Paenibacillus marchantiophytorum]|uniref:Beta-carotene 15,15'-monooxygenase n=1 Tax=Paenibacillus marchantiophytorum TaxID=1619310 RepID=A0ABQ1FJ90_9BACL|nr:hypothetical protein [Paenibacillus marchantiophytorum]GGA15503.1 hypothetical protein GCM10008018_70300 [Paenibacillus marchantiophytorum]